MHDVEVLYLHHPLVFVLEKFGVLRAVGLHGDDVESVAGRELVVERVAALLEFVGERHFGSRGEGVVAAGAPVLVLGLRGVQRGLELDGVPFLYQGPAVGLVAGQREVVVLHAGLLDGVGYRRGSVFGFGYLRHRKLCRNVARTEQHQHR